MKHGTTEIAFVEDPDGYRIELIQKRGVSLSAVMPFSAPSSSCARTTSPPLFSRKPHDRRGSPHLTRSLTERLYAPEGLNLPRNRRAARR